MHDWWVTFYSQTEAILAQTSIVAPTAVDAVGLIYQRWQRDMLSEKLNQACSTCFKIVAERR